MTDKTKLDEAAILNVTADVDGMTSETTFVADDAVALAQLLKSAGLESAQFNGPAMLSVEVAAPGGSVTSRVSAPDLRSIMNLLEPEFKAAGDLEAAMADDLAAQDIEAELSAEPEMDAVDASASMDPNALELEPELDDTVDAVVDADGNLSMSADEELDGLGEEADFDYGDHDVHPTEYEGVSDRTPVQGDTKVVPSRSGDNPMKGFKDYFKETSERNYVAPVAPITPETLMDEFKGDAEAMKRRLHAKLHKYHAQNGNAEMVKQHADILNKEVDEADETGARYEIQGSMCDYKIVDTSTGEVVADKIFSGNEAHNTLHYFNSKKN